MARPKWLYLDWSINLGLLLTGWLAYTYTLAPTLLQGDVALFQYTPQVLGVTYPTGFPTYLLAAKLWLTLFPVGEVAWRMNLFSALCAGLALPIIYGLARRVWRDRPAALTAVAIFATLPTFWRWATVARVYTFNILLLAIVLWLAVWDERELPPPAAGREAGWLWQVTGKTGPWLARQRYKLAALVLGIEMGGHNTTLLLIPGLLLLFWLQRSANTRQRPPANFPQRGENRLASPPLGGIEGGLVPIHFWIIPALFFTIPLASYLYVPLRAGWLVARHGREGAIAHGLLPDFYSPGLNGLLRYFTAADFTGGVVADWAAVPVNFVTVYLPLLRQDFTWWGIALAAIGGVIMAWKRPRFFWPLLLIYLIPIPFVLSYGQGEQSAFLLTSNLALALCAGGIVALPGLWVESLQQPHRQAARHPRALTFQATRLTVRVSPFTLQPLFTAGLFILILVTLPYRQAQYSTEWLRHKWDSSIYNYWSDVLKHPLEPEGGVMATWGDLTSMWYLQHIEGQRPDLAGLYPPEEEIAAAWLARGGDLYVAGPVLESWAPEIMTRYQLLPWGRLVRLALPSADPQQLLPKLPRRQEAIFGGRLHLSGASFEATVSPGETLYAFFTWDALADLAERTRYSLRLVQDGRIVVQKDDTLLSGWFPLDHIPAGQALLGAYPLEAPRGLLPGVYHLQLAIYDRQREAWPLADGSPVLDLGPVDVPFMPATTPPGPVRFNGEIALDEFDFSVKRVKQGKGFALELLWQALKRPANNYTLLVELVDREGRVWRAWPETVETTSWRKGGQVRQSVGITIPAEAPTGDEALTVRLSWLRPDGSRLGAKRWLLPIGQGISLGAPNILPKDNRIWEQPASQNTVEANFENKAALVGYDLPQRLAIPAAAPAALPLTLYWQGRDDMDQVYTVFVHLVDAEGNLAAQHDGVQARGKEPTTGWAVGEYIRDPVEIQLPAGFEPGVYSLVMGLYTAPDGPRLLRLAENGGVIGDSIQIGTVHIEREQ